jgi:hypothetical protein
MSVVIVTHDDYASVARPIRHLAAQTVRDRIELVVVAPTRNAVEDGIGHARAAGFQDVRVVEHGRIVERGVAAASGVRASRAPVVGFVENHSFPASRWAEALLRAHAGPWAIVGPAVENANPVNRTSLVNFAVTYGPWTGRRESGEVELLPFHNSAYKRAWLDAFGDRLGALLDDEYRLQSEIRARGGRLYLEPAATVAHTNETRLGTSLRLLFGLGIAFGVGRSADWSVYRRAGYVLGAPAIPLVNLPRVLRDAAHTLRGVAIAASLPSIVLHVAAQGAGEALGYLTGRPRDGGFLSAHEFSHRPE